MTSWENVFNISIEDYVYKPYAKKNPSTRCSFSQESSTCDSKGRSQTTKQYLRYKKIKDQKAYIKIQKNQNMLRGLIIKQKIGHIMMIQELNNIDFPREQNT